MKNNIYERFNSFAIVRITSNDGLSRKVWRFTLQSDYNGWLCRQTYYGEETRKSRRHKWVPQKWWQGFAHRDNTFSNQPSLPFDVKSEAVRRAAEKFAVLKFQ